MKFNIQFTGTAHSDLIRIYQFLAENESPERARQIILNIRKQVKNLSQFPYRGRVVRELAEMGVQEEYHETFFKSYRIIYEIIESNITIYVIADGRRDMRTLLAARLLGD